MLRRGHPSTLLPSDQGCQEEGCKAFASYNLACFSKSKESWGHSGQEWIQVTPRSHDVFLHFGSRVEKCQFTSWSHAYANTVRDIVDNHNRIVLGQLNPHHSWYTSMLHDRRHTNSVNSDRSLMRRTVSRGAFNSRTEVGSRRVQGPKQQARPHPALTPGHGQHGPDARSCSGLAAARVAKTRATTAMARAAYMVGGRACMRA
jgi:hypothetical protein